MTERRDRLACGAAFAMWRNHPPSHRESQNMEEKESKQALYLVMGGRVTDPRNVTFSDPESIHVAGVFSSYENAVEAWRSNAQRTVDDAEMKYVIVHIHKLLEPAA